MSRLRPQFLGKVVMRSTKWKAVRNLSKEPAMQTYIKTMDKMVRIAIKRTHHLCDTYHDDERWTTEGEAHRFDRRAPKAIPATASRRPLTPSSNDFHASYKRSTRSKQSSISTANVTKKWHVTNFPTHQPSSRSHWAS
jgi:hypothetical protein